MTEPSETVGRRNCTEDESTLVETVWTVTHHLVELLQGTIRPYMIDT